PAVTSQARLGKNTETNLPDHGLEFGRSAAIRPPVVPPIPAMIAILAAVVRPPPAAAAAVAAVPAPAPAEAAAPAFTVGAAAPGGKHTSRAPPFFLSVLPALPCGVRISPSLFFLVRRMAQPEISVTLAPF